MKLRISCEENVIGFSKKQRRVGQSKPQVLGLLTGGGARDVAFAARSNKPSEPAADIITLWTLVLPQEVRCFRHDVR